MLFIYFLQIWNDISPWKKVVLELTYKWGSQLLHMKKVPKPEQTLENLLSSPQTAVSSLIFSINEQKFSSWKLTGIRGQSYITLQNGEQHNELASQLWKLWKFPPNSETSVYAIYGRPCIQEKSTQWIPIEEIRPRSSPKCLDVTDLPSTSFMQGRNPFRSANSCLCQYTQSCLWVMCNIRVSGGLFPRGHCLDVVIRPSWPLYLFYVKL